LGHRADMILGGDSFNIYYIVNKLCPSAQENETSNATSSRAEFRNVRYK